MEVYRVRNSQNDKVFIGFATDLPVRFNRYKAELKFGSHRNRELQEMWTSFGESVFEFEILDVLDHEETTQANPDEELHVLAEMWIQKLKKSRGFYRVPEKRVENRGNSWIKLDTSIGKREEHKMIRLLYKCIGEAIHCGRTWDTEF